MLALIYILLCFHFCSKWTEVTRLKKEGRLLAIFGRCSSSCGGGGEWASHHFFSCSVFKSTELLCPFISGHPMTFPSAHWAWCYLYSSLTHKTFIICSLIWLSRLFSPDSVPVLFNTCDFCRWSLSYYSIYMQGRTSAFQWPYSF